MDRWLDATPHRRLLRRKPRASSFTRGDAPIATRKTIWRSRKCRIAEEATAARVAATDAEVQRVVLAGKGLMPSFAGRFTDEQIRALLAYLHTGLR